MTKRCGGPNGHMSASPLYKRRALRRLQADRGTALETRKPMGTSAGIRGPHARCAGFWPWLARFALALSAFPLQLLLLVLPLLLLLPLPLLAPDARAGER